MKNFVAKLIFCAVIVFPLMELVCWIDGRRGAITNCVWPRMSTADIQLPNPTKDAAMNEVKADAPVPTADLQPEKEPPLIFSTVTGTGEEFDGTRSLRRPLTSWEKMLARKMRKISLSSGWKYAPLEERETVGTHAITVVTQGDEAGEFAGIYYRDTPLEEWEKQLARALLELARENGGDDQSEKK